MVKHRAGHVSQSKMPGIPAWIVRCDGKKAGVVRLHADGMFAAVAGHDRLGEFSTKIDAVEAVVARYRQQETV